MCKSEGIKVERDERRKYINQLSCSSDTCLLGAMLYSACCSEVCISGPYYNYDVFLYIILGRMRRVASYNIS